MGQLVRCVNCDEVFLRTPYDQSPEYAVDFAHERNSFRTIEKDDFQRFLDDHRGHRLEDLRIIEDSFVSEKDYIEPVKASYFRATNGKEKFVVKRFREKIGAPLKCQLIHGDYSLRCVAVEIQSKEIVKQLEVTFKGRPLLTAKITAFLKLFEHLAQSIDINHLERIHEESAHPLEVYYKMDDFSLIYLLRNCRSIFQEQEFAEIQEFIHRQKDDGVLLLRALYEIQIDERMISEIETPPAFLACEKVHLGEKA